MMKLLLVAIVAALFGVSISTEGLVAALAALLAFAAVIVWAWKSKQAVHRNEAHTEPHV
ncbi:hypothetical protein [Vibrio gangliei]|uniref:hypothetical protein n=1 Tax=Vibrio gangliei TaxID=2077090 RepID=UPI00130017A6|nr:hypothetical protein [Vibrio gangliei]